MAWWFKKPAASQGLANPVFYSLAAKENTRLATRTPWPPATVHFLRHDTGTNAMNCITGDTDCVTNVAGDLAGI